MNKPRKKPSSQSPTKLSLAHARAMGWVCGITEHWNHFAKIRQDLFGCIDILCLRMDRNGCTGIQCTVTGGMQERVRKIQREPRMLAWLECGNGLQVWGWAKRCQVGADGKKGKRKVWTLSWLELGLDENNQIVVRDPNSY